MFFDLTNYVGQKSKNKIFRFLVQMRTRKFAFEIYWPLLFKCHISNNEKHISISAGFVPSFLHYNWHSEISGWTIALCCLHCQCLHQKSSSHQYFTFFIDHDSYKICICLCLQIYSYHGRQLFINSNLCYLQYNQHFGCCRQIIPPWKTNFECGKYNWILISNCRYQISVLGQG